MDCLASQNHHCFQCILTLKTFESLTENNLISLLQAKAQLQNSNWGKPYTCNCYSQGFELLIPENL